VAGRLGGAAQDIEGGPRPLGVHVVRGDRRHAAPIVDARRQQRSEVVGEVGRGLEVDGRVEEQPGGGDGPDEFLFGARGPGGHGRAELGQEVLDDDLLDVAVPAVRLGNGLEGTEAIRAVLPDADQDAGGEGDGELPGCLEGGEAAGGDLVGGPAVGREVLDEGLEHHALAGRHRAELRQLVGVERPGVGVR